MKRDNFSKFTKDDIDFIISESKSENKKYLYEIITIKNISCFDASFIMSHINLNEKIIKTIKEALAQYEQKKLNDNLEFNTFLYGLIRNIEKLENGNIKLIQEVRANSPKIRSFKSLIDFLVKKSSPNLNRKIGYNYTFKKIF